MSRREGREKTRFCSLAHLYLKYVTLSSTRNGKCGERIRQVRSGIAVKRLGEQTTGGPRLTSRPTALDGLLHEATFA